MAEETIWLQRPTDDVPWGFRLYGGRDFHCPLSVQKVTGGSIASTGLSAGDVIVRIGDADTGPLTHAMAMMAIKNAGNTLQLTVAKAGTAANPVIAASSGSPATYGPPSAAPQTPPTGGVYRSISNDGNPYAYVPTGSPYHTRDYPFGTPTTVGGGFPNGSHDMTSSYDSTEPDYYSGAAGGGNDESGYYGGSQTQDAAGSGYGATQPSGRTPPAVPDAILNMAAKGPQDKKPFAYVADVNDIREQRDRVRKRTPASTLPRYQHMLNMPQFDDPTPRRVRSTPPPADRSSTEPSDTAMVANLQFNTPLGLYSSENVVEALHGQTGGQITGVVGLPKKDKGDITQSAVYKMIHGIDQPKPKPVIARVESQQHQSTPPRQPSTDDEMRFSGLHNRNADIPSKSFQRLQSWTGTSGNTGGSEIDTTSIRRNVTGGVEGDQEPGSYDEKSIRYTGRNIPSRSFRMLQQMTGGADNSASPGREFASDDEVRSGGIRSRSETPKRVIHAQQQPQHQQQQQQPHVNVGGSEIDTTSIRHQLLAVGDDNQDVGKYDQTSIRYTGKNIPSRSFRMLQNMTGGDPGTPPVQQHARTGRQPTQQQQQQPQPQRRYRTPSEHDASQQQQQQQEEQPADDAAAKKDIRYVGGSIPSHSFRMLQQSIGIDSDATALQQPATTDGASSNGGDMLPSASLGRKVKVVRLRSQASTEDTGATEF